MDEPSKRPGSYPFRLVPDQNYILSGSNGDKTRKNTFRKHQAVIDSLSLIKSPDIKQLDEPYDFHGKSLMLRKVLLDLPYPIGKSEEIIGELFHTADYAASGDDQRDHIVYFTAYKDRSSIAERLVAILPAYIKYVMEEAAARAWFHPQACQMIHEVEFQTNDDGDWLGTWTTAEDDLNQELLDEDMGFHLQLEGLDLLQDDEDSGVLLRADNASVASFGTACGRPGTHETILPDAAAGDSNNSNPSEDQPSSSDNMDDAAESAETGGDGA